MIELRTDPTKWCVAGKPKPSLYIAGYDGDLYHDALAAYAMKHVFEEGSWDAEYQFWNQVEAYMNMLLGDAP